MTDFQVSKNARVAEMKRFRNEKLNMKKCCKQINTVAHVQYKNINIPVQKMSIEKNVCFSTKKIISIKKCLSQYKNIYFNTNKVSELKYKHIPRAFKVDTFWREKDKKNVLWKACQFRSCLLCVRVSVVTADKK